LYPPLPPCPCGCCCCACGAGAPGRWLINIRVWCRFCTTANVILGLFGLNTLWAAFRRASTSSLSTCLNWFSPTPSRKNMRFYQPKEATTHGWEYGSYRMLLMEESKKLWKRRRGKMITYIWSCEVISFTPFPHQLLSQALKVL
jgi:hypothetical protein